MFFSNRVKKILEVAQHRINLFKEITTEDAMRSIVVGYAQRIRDQVAANELFKAKKKAMAAARAEKKASLKAAAAAAAASTQGTPTTAAPRGPPSSSSAGTSSSSAAAPSAVPFPTAATAPTSSSAAPAKTKKSSAHPSRPIDKILAPASDDDEEDNFELMGDDVNM